MRTGIAVVDVAAIAACTLALLTARRQSAAPQTSPVVSK
jgi:hypothetical protein